MKELRKILAPTDLSELSLAGVRYALEMAKSQGAAVIVYHVIEYKEVKLQWEGFYAEFLAELIFPERRKMLDNFLRAHCADVISQVSIRQEVEVGIPHKRILEKAEKERVDLIVMSTHGRTGMMHTLIGSVTEKVVRLAACPVLSVRPTKVTQVAAAA